MSVDWASPEGNLRRGAILQDRIVSQRTHSKTSPVSGLGVLFDSGQCGGREMKPLPVTMAAVLGPSATERSNLYQGEQNQFLSDAFGLTLNGKVRISNAADTVFLEPSRPKLPKAVMPGQVVGLKALKQRRAGLRTQCFRATSTRQAFSPDGTQLAVLRSDQISLSTVFPSTTPLTASELKRNSLAYLQS